MLEKGSRLSPCSEDYAYLLLPFLTAWVDYTLHESESIEIGRFIAIE